MFTLDEIITVLDLEISIAKRKCPEAIPNLLRLKDIFTKMKQGKIKDR